MRTTPTTTGGERRVGRPRVATFASPRSELPAPPAEPREETRASAGGDRLPGGGAALRRVPDSSARGPVADLPEGVVAPAPQAVVAADPASVEFAGGDGLPGRGPDLDRARVGGEGPGAELPRA